MATTLSFAYNSGSTLSNCQQIGQLAFLTGGTLPPQHPNTNRFWPSPDIDAKYIIAKPDSGSTRTSTIGITPFLGFNGTLVKTDNAFTGLASEYLNLPSNTYSNAAEWRAKLSQNNIWTNYYSGVTIVGSATATTRTNSLTLTTPAGSVENDFVFIFSTSNSIRVTGGTENWRIPTGTTVSPSILYKILYSGETVTYTVSSNLSSEFTAAVVLVRGLDTNQFPTTDNFISQTPGVLPLTQISSPTGSTNQVGSLIFYLFSSFSSGSPGYPISVAGGPQLITNATGNSFGMSLYKVDSNYPENTQSYLGQTSQAVGELEVRQVVFNTMNSFPRTYRVFFTTGSWVKPTGVTQILVECWGAGGAGGGATTNQRTGGGGAGGQYARSTLTYPSGSQTISFTIGAGGVGGTGNGPVGGDTSWDGGLVLAKGGAGGQANLISAPGGVGSIVDGVGNFVYSGGSGLEGQYFSFQQSCFGGGGGPTFGSENRPEIGADIFFDYGANQAAGGLAQFSGFENGSVGNKYGGGGGGAARFDTANASGGSGGPGLIRVSWLPVS